MNQDFPRILTFLRKERGLSQKKAAQDLEISQALLSHYEKGIRECGLDFLVKAADYFDVSTDYLLGRTMMRKPAEMKAEDLPDSDEIRHIQGNVINQVNRKLLMNTNTVIFDLLAQIGSKRLTTVASNYLMSAEYQVFRAIYASEKTNTLSMFALDQRYYKSLANASMIVDLERLGEIVDRENIALSLSPDIISGYFDRGASSLFNLIQFSERNIRKVTSE